MIILSYFFDNQEYYTKSIIIENYALSICRESDEPFEIKAPGFSMMDLTLEDHSAELLPAEDGLLVATVHHIEDVDDVGARQIRLALRLSEESGVRMVLLTSALPEEIQAWLYEQQISGLDYLFADATAIETMMRGNPGFMFLRDATVISKGRKADVVMEQGMSGLESNE